MNRRLIPTGAAAAVIVIAGVAYGAIPSATGVISGCRASDGALRVIDKEAGQKCPNSQKLIEWNQSGPAGPQGPAGPAGPSAGYVESSPTVALSANAEYPAASAFETVGSLSLPAGKYVVFAKARAFSANTSEVACRLDGSGLQDVGVVQTAPGDAQGSFSLMTGAEYSGAGTATLSCAASQGANVGPIRIIAMRVGELTLS